MLGLPIRSRYSKQAQAEAAKKKETYFDQAEIIEKQITQLIVQMINDDTDKDQALVLLRHSLKRLQQAIRFLR